jgi:hypothetical protein
MIEPAETARLACSADVRCGSRARAATGLWLLVGLSALACPPNARAEGVLERSRPEYDPLGVPAGGFLLFPSLNLSASYTDNLYAVPSGAVGDLSFLISPAATLQSNWNNHALALTAAGDFFRSSDHATENTNAWRLDAQGRIDALRDLTISLGATTSHQAEPRNTSTGRVPTLRPTYYAEDNLHGNVVNTFNRLKLSGGISYERDQYDDNETLSGQRFSQNFRNNHVTTWRARVDYMVSPDTSVFFESSPFIARSEDSAASDRDHQGVRYLVGLNLAPARLIEGELAVGYLSQTFRSASHHPVHEPSYRVNLHWYPTELLTVVAAGSEKTVDSGVIDSPVYQDNLGSLEADWEFKRDIIVSTRFGYEERDFHGTDRTDQRYTYNGLMTYHLRRGVTVSFRYQHLNQYSHGAAAGPTFTENLGTLGLLLQR